MTPLAWALVLLLLGLVFLVLEFFVPSGGALAVMCALSFLGAIVVGFFAGPWTGASILLLSAPIQRSKRNWRMHRRVQPFRRPMNPWSRTSPTLSPTRHYHSDQQVEQLVRLIGLRR